MGSATGPVVRRAELAQQDGRTLVFRPKGRWRGMPFPPGSRVLAKVESGTATLMAELDVLGVLADGSVSTRQPFVVQRFAKRRFHRTAVDLPLVVGEQACRVVDLSGCGLLAQCPQGTSVMKQDIVSAQLFLETGNPIALTLYAVRVTVTPEGQKLIGFDFMEVREMDQDRIIGYVLRQERKRLQALRKL